MWKLLYIVKYSPWLSILWTPCICVLCEMCCLSSKENATQDKMQICTIHKKEKKTDNFEQHETSDTKWQSQTSKGVHIAPYKSYADCTE